MIIGDRLLGALIGLSAGWSLFASVDTAARCESHWPQLPPSGRVDDGLESLSTDQRMTAGLRERLFLDLADKYVEQRLGSKDLDAVAECELMVEKIQNQMARAILSPPESREAAWNRSREIGAEYLAARPEQPRRLLVEVQQGLSFLAEARLAAQELTVGANRPEQRTVALERLRAARTVFDSVLRKIAAELLTAPQRREEQGPLSNLQLHSLQANVGYQIGLCHLHRAKLFEPNQTADRVDALTSAQRSFDDSLRTTDDSNPLSTSIKISRAECQRLLGQIPTATKTLADLSLQNFTDRQLADYWEQRAELAQLETGESSTAELLAKVESIPQRTPQLDLAILRLVLRWSQISTGQERERWLAAASQATAAIESRYGSYWGRLAELTLVGGAGETAAQPATATNNASLDILVRAGDNAARENRSDDALAAYRKVIGAGPAAAQTESDWRVILQTRMKISRLLEEKSAFAESASQLIEGVRQQPRHELAPWLHLQAAWCLAQVAGANPDARNMYRQLLEQHVTEYASAETVDRARLWLARLEAVEGHFKLAFDHYLAINISSDSATFASKEILSAAVSYLESIGPSRDRVASEANSLSLALRQKLKTETNGMMVATSEPMRGLLTALASLTVRYQTNDRGDLADWLGKSIEAAPPEDAWRDVATGLLIAAIATEPDRRGRAIELVETLKEPATLFQCLSLLDRVAISQPDVNDLRLKLISKLLVLAVGDKSAILELQLRQAAIWEADGSYQLAAESLNSLAAEHPRSLGVQLQYARVLQELPEKRELAIDQWRRVASGVKDRSNEWYEAKYQIARLLRDSGKKQEAKQLLEYLSAVPPGWSQSKLKADFDALLDSCK